MSFFYNINPLTSTNQDTTDIMYGRIACPAAKVSISGNRNKSAESDTGFTGYLYRGKPDAIEQKRALAQKRAWKIVNDTYASEREMDTNLQERLAHAKGLRQEKAAAQPSPEQIAMDIASGQESGAPEGFTEIGTREPLPPELPEALRGLMQNNAVTEAEIRLVVSEKGYFPLDMPVKDYPQDFIQGVLIGAWEQVFKMIQDERKVPF